MSKKVHPPAVNEEKKKRDAFWNKLSGMLLIGFCISILTGLVGLYTAPLVIDSVTVARFFAMISNAPGSSDPNFHEGDFAIQAIMVGWVLLCFLAPLVIPLLFILFHIASQGIFRLLKMCWKKIR